MKVQLSIYKFISFLHINDLHKDRSVFNSDSQTTDFLSRFHPHTCTCIYITELLVPGSSRGAAGQWFHNIHIQCHVFIDKQITLCIYLPEISLSMRSMHDSMHSYFNLLLKCYVPVYDTILTYFLCRWHLRICAWSAYDV